MSSSESSILSSNSTLLVPTSRLHPRGQCVDIKVPTLELEISPSRSKTLASKLPPGSSSFLISKFQARGFDYKFPASIFDVSTTMFQTARSNFKVRNPDLCVLSSRFDIPTTNFTFEQSNCKFMIPISRFDLVMQDFILEVPKFQIRSSNLDDSSLSFRPRSSDLEVTTSTVQP